MSTLLHIDSSPLYGRSVSRELTAAFVTQWKASHPDGRVIDRDLNATAIPPINAEWVGAVYTPEQARTPQQKKLLSLSDSCSPNWSRPMNTSSECQCTTSACLPC
jgi:FMN-dependent NADH-azoreductase